MGVINISKEVFDQCILELENTKIELENFNGSYIDNILDKLSKMDANFIGSYKSSMEIVKKEQDKTVVSDLQAIIDSTKQVVENFTYVDSNINIVKKGNGSF